MTTTQTISRERLEEIACEIGNAPQFHETLGMARMLLAAMESKPVGYRYRLVSNRGYPSKWILVDTIDQDNPLPDYEVQPVYAHAAPPAPVAVPDVVSKLLNILDRHTVELGWGEKPITLAELVIARDGREELDACRAAMQAEPVTAATVPDGWKLVPVEPTERMVIDGFESEPDETFSEPEVWEAYQAMSGCRQAAHRARLCYAAMLAAAPAAPEQEV